LRGQPAFAGSIIADCKTNLPRCGGVATGGRAGRDLPGRRLQVPVLALLLSFRARAMVRHRRRLSARPDLGGVVLAKVTRDRYMRRARPSPDGTSTQPSVTQRPSIAPRSSRRIFADSPPVVRASNRHAAGARGRRRLSQIARTHPVRARRKDSRPSAGSPPRRASKRVLRSWPPPRSEPESTTRLS